MVREGTEGNQSDKLLLTGVFMRLARDVDTSRLIEFGPSRSRQGNMQPSLPVELWMLITRFAMQQPWDSTCFLPHIGNFECVEGFANTSIAFRKIVQALKDEILVVSLHDFPYVLADNVKEKKVRYVRDTPLKL